MRAVFLARIDEPIEELTYAMLEMERDSAGGLVPHADERLFVRLWPDEQLEFVTIQVNDSQVLRLPVRSKANLKGGAFAIADLKGLRFPATCSHLTIRSPGTVVDIPVATVSVSAR